MANGMNEIMRSMFNLQIQSVLVEGGTKLLQSFIDEGLWDEVRIIENTTMNIEHGIAAPVFNSGALVDTVQLENDTVRFYRSPIPNDTID
jgi:diaminohydroxyphosphoribosylaminopyrimidine deaminase/5-amino-6-(5-phosphoribosylamino)uracil reductase